MEIFNTSVDKVGFDELNEDVKKKIKSAADVVAYDLNRHAQDKRIHITNAERDNWNAKAPNESPALTGTPTSTTPTLADINNRIATTAFVANYMRGQVPEKSNTTGRLASAVNVSINGAVNVPPTPFDGSADLVLNATAIDASRLEGLVPKTSLSGTYNISISGVAETAKVANSVAGISAHEILSSTSPKLTGVPTAPTPKLGDRTDQIATTRFVAKAIDEKLSTIEVASANRLKRPFNLSITGKATADAVSIDGSTDVTINIKSIDYDYSHLNSELNVTRVNGYTIGTNVPADAKFTDTIYVHPNTETDLTGTEYLLTTVDRQGHTISGRNPDMLNVNISKNAATASKLVNKTDIGLVGVTATPAKFDGSASANITITSIPATLIEQTADLSFISRAEKEKLASNLITEAALDTKIAAVKADMDWKETVDTVEELKSIYPNPQKGWTVNVSADNGTYRYDGTKWVNVFSNVIGASPSSTTADGYMSKEDKKKLDSIEANANRFVMPTTLPASMITEDDTHKFVTDAEKTKLGSVYTRDEINNAFVTKQQIESGTGKAGIGNGWTIESTTTGLEFKFNGVTRMSLDTQGNLSVASIDLGDGDGPEDTNGPGPGPGPDPNYEGPSGGWVHRDN